MLMGLALAGASGLCMAAGEPDAAQLEQGKLLFQSKAVPACAICHTMQDAGASGTIGANLDELKPKKDRIIKALKEGLGAMPSFAATLSEADMNAVAAYVEHATGADK